MVCDGATGFYRRWHAELPLEGDSGLLPTWLCHKTLQLFVSCATISSCSDITITTNNYTLYSSSLTERSPGPLITSRSRSWRRGELRGEELSSWGEEKCVGVLLSFTEEASPLMIVLFMKAEQIKFFCCRLCILTAVLMSEVSRWRRKITHTSCCWLHKPKSYRPARSPNPTGVIVCFY